MSSANEKQTQTRRLIKKKVVFKIVTKSEMEKENERLKAKIAELEEDRDEAERILNEEGYWWSKEDKTYKYEPTAYTSCGEEYVPNS